MDVPPPPKPKKYEYKQVNITEAQAYMNDIGEELNKYARNGWRVVSVLSTEGHNLVKAKFLLERLNNES